VVYANYELAIMFIFQEEPGYPTKPGLKKLFTGYAV
jgi:hypothetical protein